MKCKGVQMKGFTCRKIFINKDAGYSNVLQRIKEELYEEPNQEGISISTFYRPMAYTLIHSYKEVGL